MNCQKQFWNRFISATDLVIVVVLISFGTAAFGQEWGTLEGRIVLPGEFLPPQKLEITRDEEICGAFKLVDETVLVNKQNGGLQNVVVWLSSKEPVSVHPERAKATVAAQLDNRDCRFVPRIVPVRTNQVLKSINSDSIAHNVAVYARRNQPFSIIVPQNEPLENSFPREELLPIRVDCSIHAWMRAYLVVTDHPYVAVTDADGAFTISDLPRGRWQFKFWHEKPGTLARLNVVGKSPIELQRGAWEIEIEADSLDLGELQVDPAKF